MRVENSSGNLVFDTSHPDCSMRLAESQGQVYAFIVALDMGMGDVPLEQPIKKRYWGKFSYESEKESIRQILHTGGKWPLLGMWKDEE